MVFRFYDINGKAGFLYIKEITDIIYNINITIESMQEKNEYKKLLETIYNLVTPTKNAKKKEQRCLHLLF